MSPIICQPEIIKLIFQFAYPYYSQYDNRDLINALLNTISSDKCKIRLDISYYRQHIKDSDNLFRTLYNLQRCNINIFPKLNLILQTRQRKKDLIKYDKKKINDLKIQLKKEVEKSTTYQNMFKVGDIIVYYKSKQNWNPTLSELGWVQQEDGNYRNMFSTRGWVTNTKPTTTKRIVNIEPLITHKFFAGRMAGIHGDNENNLCLASQKLTIFYKVTKVNKKSYNITPLNMILRPVNPTYFSNVYDIKPNPLSSIDISYRLDFSQIAFDINKKTLTGSNYPSISKYEPNNQYTALSRSWNELILKKLYTFTEIN
jgi:hypothetical protein